jgi:formylmethanofuran dehydrogenase subunit B
LIVFGKYEISEHLLKKNLENFVFIPVATPGVDTDGHLMRCDGLVTIPLKKIINSPFPSLQKVISRIL